MNKDKINVLYLRKSSEDKNSQIQSIDDQQLVMYKLADKLNLKIDITFTDEKSARFPLQRIGFEQMKEIVYRGEVANILCWKMDRLSRNMLEAGVIIDFLQRDFLNSVITSDKVFNAGENVLIATVEFGIANEEIKKLSQNVKRGLASKNAKGIKPGKACLGYINEKYAPKGTKRILPDPDKFDKVRLLWNKALEKRYTFSSLAEYGNTIGLLPARAEELSKNSVRNIFKNTFYYGEYTYSGAINNGSHITMISKAEFDSIQTIYFSNKKALQEHTNNYNLLFKCGECGYTIIPEPLKYKIIKSTGELKSYKYWHCSHKSNQNNCKQGSIQENILEEQIKNELSSIDLTYEHIKIITNLILENTNNLSIISPITNFIKLYLDDVQDISKAGDEISSDLYYCQDITEKFNNNLLDIKRAIVERIFINRTLKDRKVELQKYLRFEYISKLKHQVSP